MHSRPSNRRFRRTGAKHQVFLCVPLCPLWLMVFRTIKKCPQSASSAPGLPDQKPPGSVPARASPSSCSKCGRLDALPPIKPPISPNRSQTPGFPLCSFVSFVVNGFPYNKEMPPIRIIGAGLAGSEAAWQCARQGIAVELFEMRPVRCTPAHQTADFAEQEPNTRFSFVFLCVLCG